MLVVSIVVGACILCAMAYLALSKKSRFWIRIAALIALGVMIFSLVVCLIVIISGGTVVAGKRIIPDIEIPVEPPRPAGDSLLIVSFVLILIALFVTVLVLSLRDIRNKKP